MSATAAEHTGVGQAPARQGRHNPVANPFRQPKAVWAVAFACVVSFMGIGLVDPILPSLATRLKASPSHAELLFTSYLGVTAAAISVLPLASAPPGPTAPVGPRRCLARRG